MDFYDARALYLADLSRLGRSENTIKSASQALAMLDPYETCRVDLLDYGILELGFACHEQLAPASYNRYRSALISFFDYCVSHGYCQTNPAKQLPTRRVVDQPKLILTPEQMLQMLDGANPVERIALALGMNTALRASDIVSLKVGDIDLPGLTLRTSIQKTGSYDEKPITNQLALELHRWYGRYATSPVRPEWLDGHEPPRDYYLVPSYQMTPAVAVSDPTIETKILVTHPRQPLTHPHRLVQRALERLGLPTEGEGFHTLRRSSARALFEKLRAESNYDHALMVVKEFLNHRSVEQTQRYLGVNHERQIRDEVLRGQDFLVKRCSSVCDLLHCALPEGHPLPHSTQGTDQTIAPVCWTYGTEEPRPFVVGTSVLDAIKDGLIPAPYANQFLRADYYDSAGETLASNVIDINRRHATGFRNPERIY